MDRHSVLRWTALGVLFCSISPSARADFTDPIPAGNITLKLNSFATVNTGTNRSPQDLVSANDGTGRLFVATRGGQILTLSPTGTITGTYLNFATAAVSIYNDVDNASSEGGFAGLAFSPNFATNGKFYTLETEDYSPSSIVDFSHPEMAPQGSLTPSNHIVLREWTANGTPSQSTSASTTSRVIMRINHPQINHQGGALKFGPDGNLYLSLGDGGGGDDNNGGTTSIDGHTNFNATTRLGGNGQDLSVVMGKILRINPDDPDGGGQLKYSVPANNPFVNTPGAVPEIYAYGLRNPFRMSFDSQTGKLYAGDVGQDAREEIDEIISGNNYGWPIREGSLGNSPWTTPSGFNSVAPIAEYLNNGGGATTGGNATIGGFVYRGSEIPALFGKYVFGDLNGGPNSIGRLFYTDPAGGGPIFELKLDPSGLTLPGINSQLYGFGEDANHELYAYFANGQIVRFVPEPALALAAIPILLVRRRRRIV